MSLAILTICHVATCCDHAPFQESYDHKPKGRINVMTNNAICKNQESAPIKALHDNVIEQFYRNTYENAGPDHGGKVAGDSNEIPNDKLRFSHRSLQSIAQLITRTHSSF